MQLTNEEKQAIIEKRIEVLKKLKTLTIESIDEYEGCDLNNILYEMESQLSMIYSDNMHGFRITLKNDILLYVIKEREDRYALVSQMGNLIAQTERATMEESKALKELYAHCEQEIKDYKYNAAIADLDYILESI